MGEPNYSLGDKIRKYRKLRKLSQFDLEIKIAAAFGSISRIENNLVKPTKETLSKISQALDLKPSETADLLGLKIFSPEELITAINKISRSLNLDSTLQTAVDIMFDLYPNYNGGVILLLENDYLRSKTLSNMPGIKKVIKLLPTKPYNLKVSLTKDKENLFIKSVINNKIYQSKNLSDFTKGAFSDVIALTISKLQKFSIGISIPLIYNNKIIGVVLFSKRFDSYFLDEEVRLLKLFSDQLAIAINNAKRFQDIQLKK